MYARAAGRKSAAAAAMRGSEALFAARIVDTAGAIASKLLDRALAIVEFDSTLQAS